MQHPFGLILTFEITPESESYNGDRVMTYVLNSEGMVKAVNDEHFLEKEKPIIPANPPRK